MGRTILVAILLLLPLATAQAPGIDNPYESTPTTMYLHINGIQDAPVNTQKPHDSFFSEPRVGIAPSLCLQNDGTTLSSQSRHTWYGYSSPSIVEYDRLDQDGKPIIHPERGISYDIELDSNVDPVFHWYMVGVNPSAANDADKFHPPIPNVVVRTIVREGDDVSVGDEAFNLGQVIAQGQTEPTTLAGSATQQNDFVEVIDMGDRWLYAFTIPLSIEKDLIDKEEAYNIRVDAFMDEPLCQGPNPGDDGDYAMSDNLLIHTSADHRPRLNWSIMNPLVIEALHPMIVGDHVIIHTASNSPWGSYDVLGDVAYEPEMTLEITGPSQVVSVEKIQHKEHTRGHYAHTEPVMVVWQWDYLADQAKDGIYTFTLRVQNDQRTAEAVAVATFQIGDGKPGTVCRQNLGEEMVCEEPELQTNNKNSPGASVALLALAALGLARARRT